MRTAAAASSVAAAAAVVAVVAVLGVPACSCENPVRGPTPPPPVPKNTDPLTTALSSEARRLSQAEIDRTLRDVLNEPSRAASRLLTPDAFTPYDNDYTLQLSSAAYVDALEALTVDVAQRALASDAARAVIIPCAPAAADDADCFRAVVSTNGRRLLRRPLEADEVDAYMPFLAFAREQSPFYAAGFDTAVELALRAFLLDPEFLFRIEVGEPTREEGVARLNPYETATRMSYLLWGSAPDDALAADADDGNLDAADTRADVARRMLADARAKEQLQRFHSMWLGYRAIPTSPDLAQRFAQETNALIDRVVFDEQRDYLDTFLLEETFVDDALADHYGLAHPSTSPAPGWVSYAGTDRAGILSQGAVLASFSKFTDTSPTQRGILVRSRLLCLPIDPPPPNVNVDNPPPAVDDAVCKVDRYRAHTSSPSCLGCHGQMDPIGFGLESYDIAGRFRAHDDDNDACLIDGSGELPGFGSFNGPKELARLLVDNSLVGPCFMQQLSSYETGRRLSDDERAVADAWSAQFESGGRKLDALFVQQVEGEQFVTRREPPESEPGSGVAP